MTINTRALVVKSKCYSPSPYWIVNEDNQRVRVQLYHCINCGYEPEVKEAETMLEDPSRRDKRFP